MNEKINIDPATRYVRSLDGDYFLLREVAEYVGVSQFTLRKFISDNVESCVPSKYAMFGKTRIYLYTRQDIESIREYVKKRNIVYDHDGQARKIGRPAKYTKEERVNRSRLYSKAWYWRNRSRMLAERGDITGAEVAIGRARLVEKELKDED